MQTEWTWKDMEMLEQYRSKSFDEWKNENEIFYSFFSSVRDEGTPIVPIDGDDSEESDREGAAEPKIPPPRVAEVKTFIKIKLSL